MIPRHHTTHCTVLLFLFFSLLVLYSQYSQTIVISITPQRFNCTCKISQAELYILIKMHFLMCTFV